MPSPPSSSNTASSKDGKGKGKAPLSVPKIASVTVKDKKDTPKKLEDPSLPPVPTTSVSTVPPLSEDSLAEKTVSSVQGVVEMPDLAEMVAAVSRKKEKDQAQQEKPEEEEYEDVPAEALSVVSDVKELEDRLVGVEAVVTRSREEVLQLSKDIKSMKEDITSVSTIVNRLARVIDRASRVEESISKAESSGESTVKPAEGDIAASDTLNRLKDLRDEVGLGNIVAVSAATANKNAPTSTPVVYRRRKM